MVTKAVMRAWQVSREQQAGDQQSHQGHAPTAETSTDQPLRGVWANPERLDHASDDASALVKMPNDIVPRRRGAPVSPSSDEGYWTSHLFWKGVLVGVVVVVLIKAMLAAQAGGGMSWYG